MMTLTVPPTVRAGSDYARLMAEVQLAGLLERSGWRYLPRLLTLAAFTGVGVVALARVDRSWWMLGIAAYFGVVMTHFGFLGHDAGHQQVFRSKRWNDRAGMVVSTLGVGLSYGWWVDKHNRHHRNPNEVGRDPDVDRNVFAWTPGQAQDQRGILRLIARHQGVMFFPLLLLEGWNLHVGSLRALLHRQPRTVELLLLGAHVVGGIALLLTFLSSARAVIFVLVEQSVLGLYLGSTFAPNHKGMTVFDDGQRPDFLRRQVLTSRNLVGGRLTDLAFGGLSFQIEHHLFPSMPSANLRRCAPLVRRFCAEHSVTYTEAGVFASYRIVLRYLASIRPDRRGGQLGSVSQGD
jgi:fatty acid desaturase